MNTDERIENIWVFVSAACGAVKNVTKLNSHVLFVTGKHMLLNQHTTNMYMPIVKGVI